MTCKQADRWEPAYATESIRKIGCHPALSLAYKVHAVQRMAERGITTSDVMWLLRRGFVHEGPTQATQLNFYKHRIVGLTPNSNGRSIEAVVIPNIATNTIKIVTVFWVDDLATRSGTLTEG